MDFTQVSGYQAVVLPRFCARRKPLSLMEKLEQDAINVQETLRRKDFEREQAQTQEKARLEAERKKPLAQKRLDFLRAVALHSEDANKSLTGLELLQLISELEKKNHQTVSGGLRNLKRLLPGHHTYVYSMQLWNLLEPLRFAPIDTMFALVQMDMLKLIRLRNLTYESAATMGLSNLVRMTRSKFSFKVTKEGWQLLEDPAVIDHANTKPTRR